MSCDLHEAPSGSEADPTDTEAFQSEDQSYQETVRHQILHEVVLHKYVCPSCHDNPLMGTGLAKNWSL